MFQSVGTAVGLRSHSERWWRVEVEDVQGELVEMAEFDPIPSEITIPTWVRFFFEITIPK